MGVFAVKRKEEGLFLDAASNLPGWMNCVKFQLGSGMHPNKNLQAAWNAVRGEGFAFAVLETLPYDKDESKTDYADKLEILKQIWLEKLEKEKK